jgi:tRNA pseudouridine32 synthase/23S rRNA pseudouridine746 synthase/23S rRNA pseudouridine1911/1915/1917 synthase
MHWKNTKTQPLLEALKEGFPESSTNTLRSWIADQRITIHEKTVSHAKQMVYPGEMILLGKRKIYMEEGIEILYEDKQIIVLHKPAGILSVATDHDLVQNVHSYLKQRLDRKVFPVHRIDRDASGVMVFAYTEEAQKLLKEQFEEHSILRSYIAVVEGELKPSQGTWQSYLYEDGNFFVRSIVNTDMGQKAITHYKVLQYGKKTTTLLVSLETGRKNQIRVHCSEAGHPILGDKKYKSKAKFESRVALHAYKLGFEHPIFKKPMVFEKTASREFAPYLPQG